MKIQINLDEAKEVLCNHINDIDLNGARFLLTDLLSSVKDATIKNNEIQITMEQGYSPNEQFSNWIEIKD